MRRACHLTLKHSRYLEKNFGALNGVQSEGCTYLYSKGQVIQQRRKYNILKCWNKLSIFLIFIWMHFNIRVIVLLSENSTVSLLTRNIDHYNFHSFLFSFLHYFIFYISRYIRYCSITLEILYCQYTKQEQLNLILRICTYVTTQ